MATNDPICRECRNDRKEEDEDSDGDSKQVEGGARKDRVSLLPKANVLFRRLDESLVNIIQGGLQEHKPAGGDTGEKVSELDMEASPKAGQDLENASQSSTITGQPQTVKISIYGTIARQLSEHVTHVAHPSFALTFAVPSSSIMRAFAAPSNVVAERAATNFGISASMTVQ